MTDSDLKMVFIMKHFLAELLEIRTCTEVLQEHIIQEDIFTLLQKKNMPSITHSFGDDYFPRESNQPWQELPKKNGKIGN